MTHELFRIILEGVTAGMLVIAWILREATLRHHIKKIVKRMKPSDEELAKINRLKEKRDLKMSYKLRKNALKVQMKQLKAEPEVKKDE